MNLTPEHLRSSYEVYVEHGNSSSATIMSVLNNLRSQPGGKENIVACAFGPGIILEMMIMKRPSLAKQSPVENGHADGDDRSTTNGHSNGDGKLNANGHSKSKDNDTQPAINGDTAVNGDDAQPAANSSSTANGN